jgi:hypothetical protein
MDATMDAIFPIICSYGLQEEQREHGEENGRNLSSIPAVVIHENVAIQVPKSPVYKRGAPFTNGDGKTRFTASRVPHSQPGVVATFLMTNW